jgi:hypothetical protein
MKSWFHAFDQQNLAMSGSFPIFAKGIPDACHIAVAFSLDFDN